MLFKLTYWHRFLSLLFLPFWHLAFSSLSFSLFCSISFLFADTSTPSQSFLRSSCFSRSQLSDNPRPHVTRKQRAVNQRVLHFYSFFNFLLQLFCRFWFRALLRFSRLNLKLSTFDFWFFMLFASLHFAVLRFLFSAVLPIHIFTCIFSASQPDSFSRHCIQPILFVLFLFPYCASPNLARNQTCQPLLWCCFSRRYLLIRRYYKDWQSFYRGLRPPFR